MVVALLLVPFTAGLIAFWLRSHRLRRLLLVAVAAIHTSLTAACWAFRPGPLLDGWLEYDTPGLLFLSITSLLFLVVAVYAVGYLRRENRALRQDFAEGFLFQNEPEAVFTGCLLLFLASMTLVTASQHFGLLWVAVEATTLASAPLIYFHRQHRSLEATWKYLLVCSVGIALALLGNFMLAAAATSPEGGTLPLILSELIKHGKGLHGMLLTTAFLFLLVGYGTKMGLAPLHTWLPDAYSESPSLVSALLAGALENCAFLAILRAHQVCIAAGAADFSSDLLVGFGLLSMAVAAVFIIGQTDFKRMLAYSSVEHMGILALGVGLGGAGIFGSMLHAVNHSLIKASLFLVAGNILATFRTKSVGAVRGVSRVLPVSGLLWLAGFLALVGSPPFGLFLSEFTILRAALDQDRPLIAVAYLAFLALIFVGLATIVLRMVQGTPSIEKSDMAPPEASWAVLPSALLCGLVLVLGLYVPPALADVLHQAARSLGGN